MATELSVKAVACAARLYALLPDLEYSRETHVQWRDCDQACRNRNPEIGSAEFHAKTVSEYDERIAAIRECSALLRQIAGAELDRTNGT